MSRRKPSPAPRFTEETLYRLDNLLEFVKPEDLREYVLEIYHQYVIREHEMLPGNFLEMAQSIKELVDFLKFLEAEEQKSVAVKR